MKKAVLLALVFLTLFFYQGFASALDNQKAAELKRINAYIAGLNTKLAAAQRAKKYDRVQQLTKLKVEAQQTAKALEAELAKPTVPAAVKPVAKPVSKKPVAVVPVSPNEFAKKGLRVGLGYAGGGGLLDLGYALPGPGTMAFLIEGGYGLGNGYSLSKVNVAGLFPGGGRYLGLEVGLFNYSQTVENIPGVSGSIPAGYRTGVGVFAGTKIGPLVGQIGYNTAFGLVVKAVHYF